MQLAPQYRQLDLFRKIRSPFGQKSIILQKQKTNSNNFQAYLHPLLKKKTSSHLQRDEGREMPIMGGDTTVDLYLH